jgi:hypothetical protein
VFAKEERERHVHPTTAVINIFLEEKGIAQFHF